MTFDDESEKKRPNDLFIFFPLFGPILENIDKGIQNIGKIEGETLIFFFVWYLFLCYLHLMNLRRDLSQARKKYTNWWMN